MEEEKKEQPPQSLPAPATEVKKKKKPKKKKGPKPAEGKNEGETGEYFGWLKENKVVVNGLSIHAFPDTGRGVKAEKNIAVGEKVLTVPHTLFVTARSVRATHALKPVFHAFPKTDDDDVLAVFLMFERQLTEKNGQTQWAHHIRQQPKTYSNVLFFSPEELGHLKGSNLSAITTQLVKQVEEDYKSNFPKILQKFPALLDANYFTLDAYKWALSTIWSRAFDLTVKGKRERALVPFSDMFNHSFEAQVEHHFDDQLNSFVFTATKPIKAQEQVFICYDPKISNIRLLRLYGFCAQNNPNDVVDLYAPLNPAVPMYDVKKRFLTRLAILDNQNFPIAAFGNISNSLLNYLRIRRIHEESEMEAAKQKIKDKNSENIVSKENEAVVLMDLQEAIFSMLRAYPTSYDEDVKLLEDMTKSGKENFNIKNAINLRMSEKKILLEATVELDKRTAELM